MKQENENDKPALGDRVKDKISGMTGIVVGITDWIYGCRRVIVQPEALDAGKPVEAFNLDEPQVTVVKRGVLDPTGGKPKPTFGPRPNATRRANPTR